MTNHTGYKPILIRLALVVLVSVVFVAAFNEIVHTMQKDPGDRAPAAIHLVIPPGTAEKVAAGGGDPALPAEMVFVVGDTLEVQNQDTVSHQLGPVWVPAGTSASLVMDKVENLAYSCTFQATRYLGLDVRQPTTLGTRLTALAVAAPTMAGLLFVYSLVLFPMGARPSRQAAPARDR